MVKFETGTTKILNVDFADIITTDGKCTLSEAQVAAPIPPNQSSAFIDVDADCRNDIVIQTEGKLEIWRGRLIDNKIKYCLSKNSYFDLDPKLGHFTISDIDRDGLLDLIFPIQDSSKILIGYNKIKLEYDWSENYCKTHMMNDLSVINDVYEMELLGHLNTDVYFNLTLVY
jgi:hypothetical protein